MGLDSEGYKELPGVIEIFSTLDDGVVTWYIYLSIHI